MNLNFRIRRSSNVTITKSEKHKSNDDCLQVNEKNRLNTNPPTNSAINQICLNKLHEKHLDMDDYEAMNDDQYMSEDNNYEAVMDIRLK